MTYRVWNNVTKKFLRTSTYIDSDGNLYKDNDPHGLDMSGKRSISPIPSCTIMRSTGLHDKNGKEIFEGDLMRFFDKTVAVIVFESFGGWCFKWIDQTYKNVRQQNPEPIFRNINLFEVVGNIHENTELI